MLFTSGKSTPKPVINRNTTLLGNLVWDDEGYNEKKNKKKTSNLFVNDFFFLLRFRGVFYKWDF